MSAPVRLVQILLPTSREQSKSGFERVMHELTERFGGATAYVNPPAEGIWDDGSTKQRDLIVTLEVMVEDFDERWWRDYRTELEERFHQKEIVIRAVEMTTV